MRRIDIESRDLAFKNIVSAPAPIGRILNYINLAKKDILYHKNGYRSTNLKNKIGCAWTTEFMIGLEIFSLGDEDKNGRCPLELTSRGEELYNLIKNNSIAYSESTSKRVRQQLKEQMIQHSKPLYDKYKKIFETSVPFQILREYLKDDYNGYVYDNRSNFINDYFEKIKKLYDKGSKQYNRDARTTTGENRLTSLLHLCEFFDFLTEKNHVLVFNSEDIGETRIIENQKIVPEVLLREAKKVERTIKLLEDNDIIKRYGVDGNRTATIVVRNSNLQRIFRNNLIAKYTPKCAICKISNERVLIGSHIKDASKSNAVEKADLENGLLLCCNHDKLFDSRLITFSAKNGKIKISKVLSKKDRKALNINLNIALPKNYLTSKRRKYLKLHNEDYKKEESNR